MKPQLQTWTNALLGPCAYSTDMTSGIAWWVAIQCAGAAHQDFLFAEDSVFATVPGVMPPSFENATGAFQSTGPSYSCP